MATSNDFLKTYSSWRDRPCHFTWNLSASVFINYDNIVRKLDYDLVETKNLLFVEKLLFRAFLEVSDHRHYRNVSKTREFLDQADDFIAKLTNPHLQNGYRSVALLNRLHIEYKSQNTNKVEDLLIELKNLKLDKRDQYVIGAVKAAALTRFGPTVRDDAIRLFEEAMTCFPKNPGFLFGALLMTGRKFRFERHISDHYDDLEADGKALMDTEREYCQKLMDINDEYQLGRSFLGQNLSRRRIGHKKLARSHLEEAYEKAPKVIAVFHNLVRFYRHDNVDKSISLINTAITSEPCLDVAESHHQLALCFNSKANRFRIATGEKNRWRIKTLQELERCLKLDGTHLIASLRKAIVLVKHGDKIQAEKLYEDLLLLSERLSVENIFVLHVDYARFLTKASSPRHIDRWLKVMESASSFEYLDVNSGRWEVKRRIKKEKEEAYKRLSDHYEEKTDPFKQGVLYFQHFEFEKAVKMFEKLDPSDQCVSHYLAKIYFKWGREKEASTSMRQWKEAGECYKLARLYSKRSTELGLNQEMGRRVLADIALATAHLQLCKAPSRHAQESECINAYREAIRCGSLIACLEILRLYHEGYVEIISRSKFLQLLAEIDVCCSQRLIDCVHLEMKPRSFKDGPSSLSTDIDFSALDCKLIKREINDTLRKDGFFRQAWKAHFDMEKKVLEERFKNNEGELKLDGREEGQTQIAAIETIYTALDCCEKLRPLLDHIVLKFEKDELEIKEEKKKQYFPIVLGERDPVRVEDQLREKLKSYFDINFRKHYPKLYQQLLEVQPGYNTEYDFLGRFWELVIHVKHKGIELTELPGIEEDAVTLTRKCTDTVAEICTFFFAAMKKSSELREALGQLVTDLKGSSRQDINEMYEKADQLLYILSDHPDLVTRIGSTWKILEMLALIKNVWEHSCSNEELEEALTKTTEGTWDLSKNLRRSHFAVELALLRTDDPSSKDVLEKCRDTCEEADKLLDAVMGEIAGRVVKFPLEDMHPGHPKLKKLGYNHWRGKVKKQLEKDLTQMEITSSVKLLEIMLQAQPCSREENYNFIALRDFIELCNNENIIPNRVFMRTLDKHVSVIDLTRWCVNGAEKIAEEIENLLLRVSR